MSFVTVFGVQVVLILFLPAVFVFDKWLYAKTQKPCFKNYVVASFLELALFSMGLWMGAIMVGV